MAAYKER